MKRMNGQDSTDSKLLQRILSHLFHLDTLDIAYWEVGPSKDRMAHESPDRKHEVCGLLDDMQIYMIFTTI
jgi:hypothetical protein